MIPNEDSNSNPSQTDFVLLSNSSNIAGQNTNLESETEVPELRLLEGVQKTNDVLDLGDLPQYPNISEIESFVAKNPQTIYPEEIPNDG